MKTMGLVFMILGALIAVGAFTYLAIRTRKLANALAIEGFDIKKEFTLDGLLGLAVGIGFLVFFLGIPFYWNTPNVGYEWVCIVFGSIILGMVLCLGYVCFRLHFYQLKFSEKMHKALFYILIAAVTLLPITIILLTEGYVNHMTFPLYNGISFTEGFVSADMPGKKPNIAWYALCILTGALYAYFLSDHYMYKTYGKHGLLDSTFLIAFPAGIIGARIAFVIGEWDHFKDDPIRMFYIWEGGLTILGGAVAGIIVGVLWFKWRHKNIPLGPSVNMLIPTILLAQAAGRWGNFFNCEVHGLEVSGAGWQWLPTFIYKQMEYSVEAGPAAEGNIFVPLFLIESIVNIVGFFILEYGCGHGLKKYVKGWDLVYGYLIWYGLTRTFMEPLRHPDFNMGADGRWSWVWAIIYAGIGVLAIVINHVVKYYQERKKVTPVVLTNVEKKQLMIKSIIGIAVISVITMVMFGVGLHLYLDFPAPTNPKELIKLVPHNVGLILWILGLCCFPCITMPIIHLVRSIKPEKPLNLV